MERTEGAALRVERPQVVLLFQLADDDLIVAHRASEWLGLAPHLEEDVAFASIAQDEMGHAAMYYRLLEDLGCGPADHLAHLRPANDRRNSRLVEHRNGPGTYLVSPRFDWAFALMRHYLYDLFEAVRLTHVVRSTYGPLADAAAKIQREERYHLAHHEMWIDRLAASEEGHRRLAAALEVATGLAADLTFVEPWAETWSRQGILPEAAAMHQEWVAKAETFLGKHGFGWGAVPVPALKTNGRLGQHSADLDALLDDLAAVYRTEVGASW